MLNILQLNLWAKLKKTPFLGSEAPATHLTLPSWWGITERMAYFSYIWILDNLMALISL